MPSKKVAKPSTKPRSKSEAKRLAVQRGGAAKEETPAEAVGPSELDLAQGRQKELLDLRDRMAKEGVDTIGKLDVLLAQVNQRVKELEG